MRPAHVRAALEKAKEAVHQERALRRAQEAAGEGPAPELTFAARLALGAAFQAAGMAPEALAAFDKILRSPEVPQVQVFRSLM